MTRPLTKTLARQETRRQLSYGYFATSATDAWVSCPRAGCPARVTVHHLAWEKPFPLLRETLTNHLIDDHQEA